MATVKLGRELREQIVTSAYNKFTQKVNEAKAIQFDDHWGDYIYETIFGGYKDVLNAVPEGFIRTRNSISVANIHGVNLGSTIDFKLTDSRPMPHTWLCPISKLVYGDFQLCEPISSSSPWAELYELVADKRKKIADAETKRNEFRNMVRTVVDSHSTLSAALRTWPPLWDIVPEYAKDRHREVVERVKKEAPTVDVDLGKLTAMVTANKFGL